MAARLAYPDRHCVAVTGDAGVGYMLGNLEVPVRQKIGITVVHVSNGGFAGYGPGFWGEGHDPFTHRVMGHEDVDMSKVAGEMGMHAERVSDPADIVAAFGRARAATTTPVSRRTSSSSAASTRCTGAGCRARLRTKSKFQRRARREPRGRRDSGLVSPEIRAESGIHGG